MTEGPDFNAKLKALGTATNRIEHFKKGTVAPATSMNTTNIEDEESDYEIKLWLDPADKTAYYYAEPEKVYLNRDSSKMFYSDLYEQKIRNVLELDLSSFDTSNVTDMQFMFSGMSSLTTLDLSNFDTSQVTDMKYMFRDMSSLTTLNLSNFDTSRVTNMEVMFYGMSSLTSLDLSNFDTSQVKYMNYMFSYMSSLTTLDLSNFDTSQVAYMISMFSGTSLTSLNLSNFDTSKVMNMSNMFLNMRNLTSLNLTNFNTSKVTDMEDMFSLSNDYASDDKLEKIYVNNDFDVSKLTAFSNMFRNRKKLRGGNGSYLADPSTADKS